jgi:hypothetical protein
MAIGEADRHELYLTLETILGKRQADTMMALLPPVGWAEVATKDDLRHESAALRKDIEALEARLSARIMRTALAVNIPSVVAAVGLAFAAARLG